MKNPFLWLVLVAVIALGGGLFLWQRYPTPGSVSEGGGLAAPLRQGTVVSDPVFDSRPADGAATGLAARQGARIGMTEVQAAARRFKDSSDCLLYHGARLELDGLLNDERQVDLSGKSLESLEYIDVTSQKYVSILRQKEAECSGSDKEALELIYADSVVKAALLGDPDAQSCFVVGGQPSLQKTGPASGNAWLRRYMRYAPTFTQKALERADPYVAARALYRYVRSPSLSPSEMETLELADPYLTYRAARLASLRALPEPRAHLERHLAMFKDGNHLKSDAMQRADEWANATYTQEFAGQRPINPQSMAPCYSSPDLAP